MVSDGVTNGFTSMKCLVLQAALQTPMKAYNLCYVSITGAIRKCNETNSTSFNSKNVIYQQLEVKK